MHLRGLIRQNGRAFSWHGVIRSTRHGAEPFGKPPLARQNVLIGHQHPDGGSMAWRVTTFRKLVHRSFAEPSWEPFRSPFPSFSGSLLAGYVRGPAASQGVRGQDNLLNVLAMGMRSHRVQHAPRGVLAHEWRCSTSSAFWSADR